MLTEAGAPQHIGTTDGVNSTQHLLGKARAAGFAVNFACRYTSGNTAYILMFETFATYRAFRLRNIDCTFSEHARHGVVAAA
jgi:hypothetical protein